MATITHDTQLKMMRDIMEEIILAGPTGMMQFEIFRHYPNMFYLILELMNTLKEIDFISEKALKNTTTKRNEIHYVYKYKENKIQPSINENIETIKRIGFIGGAK